MLLNGCCVCIGQAFLYVTKFVFYPSLALDMETFLRLEVVFKRCL